MLILNKIAMVLIIGGHERSGTTLLRNLLNAHPDITVTLEFANFLGIGKTYRSYSRQILERLWQDKYRNSSLVFGKSESKWKLNLQNYIFVARYLLELKKHQQNCIDAVTIQAALQSICKTNIVGDKMPMYVSELDKLVKIDELTRIIIYRNCLDVASSTLKNVRTIWSHKTAINKKRNTAKKIAKRWLRAIEIMENHASQVHIICYENLVRDAKQELEALSKLLEVDPHGFPDQIIRDASIGKYKNYLTEQEIGTILDVAGPTMARLGYL